MDADVIRCSASREIEAAMLQWSQQPMQWGSDDCMLAVANIVRGIVGRDPARRFRNRYRTRIGALRMLGRGGTEKAARDSARALHWRRITPGEAAPGDVGLAMVMASDTHGKLRPVHAAMICRAKGWFVGRGERGFTALPSAKVEMAWAIV